MTHAFFVKRAEGFLELAIENMCALLPIDTVVAILRRHADILQEHR